MRTLAGLAACLLLLSVASAAADSGIVTLSENQETTVATFALRAGDVVEYTWASGFPAEFRIDRQGVGEVFKTTSQATTATFTAPADGTYVFSFRSEDDFNMVNWTLTKRTDPTLYVAIGGGVAALVGSLVGLGLWQRSRGRKAAVAPPLPPPPPSA